MTSFLPRSLSVIVLAVFVGLVILDISKHGCFKASKAGIFLENSGALHYGRSAWNNFRYFSQHSYRWCKQNVPVYLAKVREGVVPYLSIALDWLTYLVYLLWANIEQLYVYFLEKRPVVEQWINKYAPGIVDIVRSWFWQSWIFVRDFTALLLHLLLKYLSTASQWLAENVFVGSLSPENIQRYTMVAVNTTQQLALQTFSWFNDKVLTVTFAS